MLLFFVDVFPWLYLINHVYCMNEKYIIMVKYNLSVYYLGRLMQEKWKN